MKVNPLNENRLNDLLAFQDTARSREDRMVLVDSRKEGDLGYLRNSAGNRCVVWLRKNILCRKLQRDEIRKTYDRLLDSIAATQHRPDDAELERVRGMLDADKRAKKPLTSYKIRQVLHSLDTDRPQHVLQNRTVAKFYTGPAYLDAEIKRMAAGMPRLKGLKDVHAMIDIRDKEALTDKIHERLTTRMKAQRTALTQETAEEIARVQIGRLLDKYSQDLPDSPIRTVRVEGYSSNLDADLQVVKSKLGWMAGTADVEAAFGAIDKDVPGDFNAGLSDYSACLAGAGASGNRRSQFPRFPAESVQRAQAVLDKLITTVDHGITDYTDMETEQEAAFVTSEKLRGLRLLKQGLEAEKQFLESVSNAHGRPAKSLPAAGNTGTGAVSLQSLMQQLRFPDELDALEQSLGEYRAMLNNKPVIDTVVKRIAGEDGVRADVEQRVFSYETSAEMNQVLDKVETAAMQLYKQVDRAGLQDPEQTLAPLLDAVDRERGLIASLLQNPSVTDRSGQDRPIAEVMAGKTWKDVLNVRRSGIEYGTHVNPDTSDLPGEKGFARLAEGGISRISRVEFVDGSEGVFKPEAFAVQAQPDELQVRYMDYYGLPLNQPRMVARNIATRNIAEAIGAGSLIPQSRMYQHDDTIGVLLEKATGNELSRHVKRDGTGFRDAALAENPDFLRDLNNLQWVDALTLQADRHNSNIMVDYKDGRYNGLKGIDNDFSFGTRDVALKDISAQPQGAVLDDAASYGYNAGLPPLIDVNTYQQLVADGAAKRLLSAVDGLLTSAELGKYKKRVDEVIDHARQLDKQGRVVGLSWTGSLLTSVMDALPQVGIAREHPWALFRTTGKQSAWEVSAHVADSYYGRMVRNTGAQP